MGHSNSDAQLDAEPDLGTKGQATLVVFLFLFVIFVIANFVVLYAYFLWEVDRIKEVNQRTYPLTEYAEHEEAAAPLLKGEKGKSIDAAKKLIVDKYKSK
tara:strand:- start:2917 stop:3216 length:300 start_codon:yes stop_codon:yes gene_type:complete